MNLAHSVVGDKRHSLPFFRRDSRPCAVQRLWVARALVLAHILTLPAAEEYGSECGWDSFLPLAIGNYTRSRSWNENLFNRAVGLSLAP